MQVEILYRPSYSLAFLNLSPGEEVRVEGGSMVGMSNGVALETQATGGVLKSLARSVLGGESFFQNVYKAPVGGGQVSVAPSLPGDLFTLHLQNESIAQLQSRDILRQSAARRSKRKRWDVGRFTVCKRGRVPVTVSR